MTTSPETSIIPVAFPAAPFSFLRAALAPGISIQPFGGQMALALNEIAMPGALGFVPTHLLLVDHREYFDALDARLAAEGITREPHPFDGDLLDFNGLTRQVLVATTLLGCTAWETRAVYTLHRWKGRTPIVSMLQNRPSEQTADIYRWTAQGAPPRSITAKQIRKVVSALDRYYRTGSWWSDPLGTALGYLWSAVTTTHGELQFIALCMALEALVTSKRSEVAHSLAERCALLLSKDAAERQRVYKDFKDIYSSRSSIVHGASGPRKGTLNLESLAVTAKHSFIPRSHAQMLAKHTIGVLNAALTEVELIAVLHTKQSDEKTSRAIDQFFFERIFS